MIAKTKYIHGEGQISLLASSLIIYELKNVFWKHSRVDTKKDYMYIKSSLISISNYRHTIKQQNLKNCISNLRNRNVNFHNASYLALAKESKIKLITADGILHKKH